MYQRFYMKEILSNETTNILIFLHSGITHLFSKGRRHSGLWSIMTYVYIWKQNFISSVDFSFWIGKFRNNIKCVYTLNYVHLLFTFTAVTWLEFCRYDLKHYTITQLIHLLLHKMIIIVLHYSLFSPLYSLAHCVCSI